MIIITQGHQEGIGLEVFFKSILVSGKNISQNCLLIAYKTSVEQTLKSLNIPFYLGDDFIQIAHRLIRVEWAQEVDFSQSFTTLKRGMELCQLGGHILFTLPTAKDQFPGFSGHTEYFRHHYQLPQLGMFFLAETLKVLLLSDHIPLREVPLLSEKILFERISNALRQFSQWNWRIDSVLIAGINPHAGEGGLIGDEDAKIAKSISKLKRLFPLEIAGPIPGDTMQLAQKSQHDLLIYPFHDQGLGIFKSLQGFIGANITLGLAYPRFSPDHGTSFALFAKNTADYRGCAYALHQALKLSESIYGRNSRQQSSST